MDRQKFDLEELSKSYKRDISKLEDKIGELGDMASEKGRELERVESQYTQSKLEIARLMTEKQKAVGEKEKTIKLLEEANNKI